MIGPSEAIKTAAEMLGGINGWHGALNYDLVQTIEHADRLVQRAGGTLRSSQALAAIIVDWIARHPEEIAYGE